MAAHNAVGAGKGQDVLAPALSHGFWAAIKRQHVQAVEHEQAAKRIEKLLQCGHDDSLQLQRKQCLALAARLRNVIHDSLSPVLLAIAPYLHRLKPKHIATWTALNEGQLAAVTTQQAVKLVAVVLRQSRSTTQSAEAAKLTGWLSASELAERGGIPPGRRNAFRKALERLRLSLPDSGIREAANPAKNAPRLLYDASLPALQKLISDYASRR